MKVPEQKSNSAPLSQTPSSEEKTASPHKRKVFSDKLRKKKADLQVPLSPIQIAVNDTSGMAQRMFQQDLGTGSVSAGADVPTAIQNLVHEIQVHVEPSGAADVRIQFESNVFDGLRVHIRKQDGSIAITFTTNNDKTSQLLSQHIPALAAALSNRGIPVTAIQFETGAASEGSGLFNSNKGSDSQNSKQRKRR